MLETGNLKLEGSRFEVGNITFFYLQPPANGHFVKSIPQPIREMV